jgi:TatD DNase family protein
MLVDSHAHIEGSRFDADREEVVARARDGGVGVILTVGQVEADWRGLEASFALADRYPFVYTSVGLHPHDARLFTDEVGERMFAATKRPKVVAWGECGLDYYYDNSPREAQRTAFRAQLRLARRADLPVIVHSRDAADETLAILEEEWSGSSRGGVFHCFTYDDEVALRAVAVGFHVSFSGILTFKSADGVQRAAAAVPIGRILVETDCPFLAPVPHRGKRNEPVFVREVAGEVARLRGTSLDEVGRATTENFSRLFGVNVDVDTGSP